MHNLTKLANTIMQILDRQPRDNKLTEYELLSIVKEYTGDNTMQLVNIHDAVSFLELQRAVTVDRFMGKLPPAFDSVKISRKGRVNFQLNRDWPNLKESLGERPVQEVHINKVDGDVQISQSGNNVMVKTEAEYEVTFQVFGERPSRCIFVFLVVWRRSFRPLFYNFFLGLFRHACFSLEAG